MVKRALIGVALLPSLMAGALVSAPPAAASVTACGPWEVAVNNSHGQIAITAGLDHVEDKCLGIIVATMHSPRSIGRR